MVYSQLVEVLQDLQVQRRVFWARFFMFLIGELHHTSPGHCTERN